MMIVEKKYWIETDQTSNRILIHSWENKVYVTIEDARIILENISGVSSTWFDGVHWFDGTLTYTAYETVEHTDTNSGLTYRTRDAVVKQLPDLGYTDVELDDEWMWVYGDRFIALPVTPYERCKSTEDFRYQLSLWVTRVSSRIAQLNASRGYKYKKLVSTLDIDYDPISNYDAMEHEFHSEQEGKHTVSREGNDSTEITNNYLVPNASFTIWNKTEDDGSIDHISGVDFTENSDTTTTTVDGTIKVSPKTKVENHTTTYDNNTGRLNNYTESSGSETTDDDTTTTVDSHSTPKFSRSETSGYRGYTDTYEAENPNKRGRIFNRTGNIGVTTTQQMLEQERNIARINVIQEYMDDINHHMLLAVY